MKKNILLLSLLLLFSSCKKTNDNSNDQPDPIISIEALSLFEGNGGTNVFDVVVKLSSASSKKVTIIYATENRSAIAGEDYTSVSNQTLTFQPGETVKNIPINIMADDIKEGDDELGLILSAATNATLQQSAATIAIRNDDTKVYFSNTGYEAPASYTGYTLSWADEFATTSLDAAAWSFENGNGCPDICGWGNNELEYYTGRPDNLFFQDGKMIIEARKENYNGFSYTSSKILTRNKKVFKYGRIDIRAKLPKGKGIWPAFWLLPQYNVFGGWPQSGEIDLMELVGHIPGKIYGTIHYGPGPGSTQISRSYTLGSGTFYDEFHVFSLEWKQDQLKWYVDGNLYSAVNKSDLGSANYPFNEDFFFIINFAIGGNWPGNPDASTYFPQWLIVDYIRVYQ